MRLTDKKEITRFGLLFAVAYTISYITRYTFSTVISEMENATAISRELLSMSVTGSFITYGVGQVLSGILGDKASPKKLISLGYLVTALMNVLIPLCNSPYTMLGVWCINGFAQSLIWPPMVRLMTTYLSQRDYERVSIWTLWGGSIGAIFVYLVAPLLISVASWRMVFIFASVCGFVMTFFWNRLALDCEVVPREKDTADNNTMKLLFSPVMIMVMISIILHGMLKDGVTTWMPSYISDTYNLSSVVSILSGVIIPLFTIFMNLGFSAIYGKLIKNPVTLAGVIFTAGAILALGIYLISGRSAFMSVVFTALLVGSMHGVNLMLIAMVPSFFKKFGNVSTVSGVINACTYVGSALSTYGIAVLSQNIGWNGTVLMWVVFALVGAGLCLGSAKNWRRKFLR